MTSDKLFRFRLTTATRLPGLFRIDSEETSFVLPDGRNIFIVARNGKNLASANKFHFESGCFETEEEARAAGEQIRLLLRLLNASLALGLNVPIDDRVSSSLANDVKDQISKPHNVQIMDNIWGILVFPDDEKHVECTLHGKFDVSPCDTLYWLDGIKQLWDSKVTLDDRSEDALELLGLASLELSHRNAFLITYLALERLLPPRKRTKLSLDLLKRLENWVIKASLRKNQPICEGERDSLVSSLGRLHYESFGNTLARFAVVNKGKDVEGIPIADFVKMCTKTRHATAHPGKHIEPEEYTHLTKGLRSLVMGVLWNKHNIPDLSVNIPPSRLEQTPGEALQFRVINYKQR